MSEKTSFTYKLSADEQAVLVQTLKRGNYRPVSVEYTTIAVQAENCRVCLYQSGKCVVQGKGAADFVTFVLEPVVLKRAGLGYEDLLDPEASRPHLGVDESGKGDFFGPLVVAGAYVDETLVPALRDMDVRDSKNIRSDKKALGMARDIRKLLGKRFALVRIGPRAYNRLYAKMRNVNRILAWAHARAIEDLLAVVPDCPRAVSDQFGSTSQVENALMAKGREIELVQRHRAESDLAVAAASILARAEFVHALQKFEKEYGQPFPKGASDKVRESAETLIKARGTDILLETAKCHFRTTDVVLEKLGKKRSDLPEEGQGISKPPAGRFGKRKSTGEGKKR